MPRTHWLNKKETVNVEELLTDRLTKKSWQKKQKLKLETCGRRITRNSLDLKRRWRGFHIDAAKSKTEHSKIAQIKRKVPARNLQKQKMLLELEFIHTRYWKCYCKWNGETKVNKRSAKPSAVCKDKQKMEIREEGTIVRQ